MDSKIIEDCWRRCPRASGVLFREPGLECLEQCISDAGLEWRRAGERGDAQMLNTPEFIDMEVEDQGFFMEACKNHPWFVAEHEAAGGIS